MANGLKPKKKTPKQLEHVKRQKFPWLVKTLFPSCYSALHLDGYKLPERKKESLAKSMAAMAALVLLNDPDFSRLLSVSRASA
jgi:hypothetical protein